MLQFVFFVCFIRAFFDVEIALFRCLQGWFYRVRADGGRRCWGLARLRVGRIHARGVLGGGSLAREAVDFSTPSSCGGRVEPCGRSG
jgi:hypothetical protein